MAHEIVKTLYNKDKSQRIVFQTHEYADNPRNTTDEPLHCADFSRDYSIMVKGDDEKFNDLDSALRHMVSKYGKREKVIDALIENAKHMTDGKSKFNNALTYDRSRKGWVLYEYAYHYNFDLQKNEMDWYEAEFFDGKKDCIDLDYLFSMLYDSTIEWCIENCMTDKVKMATYSFGYHGSIGFSDTVNLKDDGIAWLDKDEFLKYSGCEESYWKEKNLSEIEYLLDEIEAWASGDVYGFVVEKAIKYRIRKECMNDERESQDYIETEWEETDSCWGFYAEFDKAKKWMLDEAGLNEEDFSEAA